jgi:hypothetical protein
MKTKPKINLAIIFHINLFALCAVLFFFIKGYPLLGTIGFESANLLVTIVGPFLCLVAALNRKNKIKNYKQILGYELIWCMGYLIFFGGLLSLNGFYLTSCSKGTGLVPFLVIAIPPILLNVSLGSLLACLTNSLCLKIIIVLLGYAAYYSFIIYSWWQEPGFRILTHASFLMSSDLLKGQVLTPAIVGYRSATLLCALTVIMIGHVFTGFTKKMFNPYAKQPLLSIILIIALLSFSIFLTNNSLRMLGKDKTLLTKDYELLVEKDGFRIFADPLKISIKNAKAVLDEACFYRSKIKIRLGQISYAPIIIWLHHTDDDKFLYTGAKNVHFALPRHREIHLSGYSSPHPVLGHELAHIYVGELSRTIFGFPGIGYLIPNLALTEGLAMVLSKELNIQNGLTLIEQAQALYQANLRIDFDQLFSQNPLYFVQTDPHLSYVYAGAILDFLLRRIPENERPLKLRELIGSGSLRILFSHDNDKALAKAALHNKLLEEVGPDAIWWAQKSFTPTSILASNCHDHAIEEKSRFQRALLNHNIEKAKESLSQLSPRDRVVILDHAIDNMLLQSAFDMALSLIEIREPLTITQRAQLEELKLKKLDSLIGMKKFTDAQKILDDIDEHQFSLAHQRLFLILRVLFHFILIF